MVDRFEFDNDEALKSAQAPQSSRGDLRAQRSNPKGNLGVGAGAQETDAMENLLVEESEAQDATKLDSQRTDGLNAQETDAMENLLVEESETQDTTKLNAQPTEALAKLLVEESEAQDTTKLNAQPADDLNAQPTDALAKLLVEESEAQDTSKLNAQPADDLNAQPTDALAKLLVEESEEQDTTKLDAQSHDADLPDELDYEDQPDDVDTFPEPRAEDADQPQDIDHPSDIDREDRFEDVDRIRKPVADKRDRFEDADQPQNIDHPSEIDREDRFEDVDRIRKPVADKQDRFEDGDQPQNIDHPSEIDREDRFEDVDRIRKPVADKEDRFEDGDQPQNIDHPSEIDREDRFEDVDRIRRPAADKEDRFENGDQPQNIDHPSEIDREDRFEDVDRIRKPRAEDEDQPQDIDQTIHMEIAESLPTPGVEKNEVLDSRIAGVLGMLRANTAEQPDVAYTQAADQIAAISAQARFQDAQRQQLDQLRILYDGVQAEQAKRVNELQAQVVQKGPDAQKEQQTLDAYIQAQKQVLEMYRSDVKAQMLQDQRMLQSTLDSSQPGNVQREALRSVLNQQQQAWQALLGTIQTTLAELAQKYEQSGRAAGEVAKFGDMEIYRRQSRAIRSDEGIRLSEHEHISARINLFLMTLDPNLKTSPVDKTAYRNMVTLTIPRDMAVEKTKDDMQLRDRLKVAQESGIISEELVKEMDIEADIARTIRARDTMIEVRWSEKLDDADLRAITDAKIIVAAHLQQSTLFHVGKTQNSPLRDATEKEIESYIDKSIIESSQ